MIAHVKLKNGEDIVAHVEDESSEWIILKNPVCFAIDPSQGLFAKDWLMHSTYDSVRIFKVDTFIISQANREAIKYYNQFRNKDFKKPTNTGELENILTALLESKGSMKH